MAQVTRTNGSNTTIGTLYSMNANIFVVTVKNTSGTAKNLSTEDSNGIDSVVDGAVESIVKELCPLAYITDSAQASNTGKMYVIMDVSINNAAELQTRIRRLGTVGPNSTDVSGTTVTEATSFTAV
jgi:hypothetical protein